MLLREIGRKEWSYVAMGDWEEWYYIAMGDWGSGFTLLREIGRSLVFNGIEGFHGFCAFQDPKHRGVP